MYNQQTPASRLRNQQSQSAMNVGYGTQQSQATRLPDGRIDLKNYVADPSKRNDLKRRLYDSGISNIPMPSVKRPIEEQISCRPYSAKMNPQQIQNMSPIKSKIDRVTKNIYSNLQDSYKDAAAKESMYKGEGTADYYKSQHIQVPPPHVYGGNITTGKKARGKSGYRPNGIGLMPKLSRNQSQGVFVDGMSSSNKVLLNKGLKPGKLPSLGQQYQSSKNIPTISQVDPSMRLLQGPPQMSMASFEGGFSMNQKNLELARSKFLLDKLTGKLPPEMRGGAGKRMLPKISRQQSGVSQLSRQQSNASFSGNERQNQTMMSIQPKDAMKILDDASQSDPAPVQKQWSDLDKYIELLLDSKSEEETVFVYLNCNANGDPYDLLVCSYQETRDKNKYYTLSGKGLTLYENDAPQEFLSLGQWLIERDSYNHIKELDFFKKFKKWKFMRMWKKTIKRQNRMKAQNMLDEKLFILQDFFGDYLSKHRKLMIDMEQSRFVDQCLTGDTKTIEEFAEAQVERTNAIADEIQRYSDRCRENIRECISKVLTELRTRIVSEIALDEERKKNNPIQSSNTITMKKKQSTNVFEKLGFPEGMTYGHRSSLRKECSRFLRFAYLVDFLSLESLTNIYIGSVKDMIKRVKDLNDDCDIDEIMKKDFTDANATAGPRGQEPLFFVSAQLCDDYEIPNEEIVPVVIEDFVLPPRGKSSVEDFDLLAHLELEPQKEEGEDEDEDDLAEMEQEMPDPIYQKTVPNIEKFWLRMEPDEHSYIEVIIRTFASGLDQIKQFERWSKHSDLSPYADALEEWDDIVGDKWDEPDSPKLDPKEWIQSDPIYGEHPEIVRNILVNSFSKLRKFATNFQPIFEIYWRNKQFDMQILVDETLKNPTEGLDNVINLFNHYHDLFSARLPTTADIGLIQLDSKESRKKIQPTPKDKIKEIEKFIPVVLRARIEESKKWLNHQFNELSRPVTNVEEYVDQLGIFNYVELHFQDVRDRISLIGQMQGVFTNQQLKVKKEDSEALKEATNIITNLSNLHQQVDGQQIENKERFRKDLLKLTPQLSKDIDSLYDRAVDPKFTDQVSLNKMFDILQEMDEIEVEFKQLEETKERYNRWQIELETNQDAFENLEELREQFTLRALMWRSLNEWQDMNEQWLKTVFTEIDAADIKTKAEKYAKNCMRIEKNLDPNPIQVKLKNLVETFKEAMPIVTALRNDKLTEVHWAQIKNLIKKDFDVTEEDFTLKSLIDLDIVQFQEDITSISTKATQEANLAEQIDQIKQTWQKINFVVEYEDRCDCNILKDLDDIYTALDESLANLNMILGSRFVAPLRVEAEKLKGEIMMLSDVIDQWVVCQKNWRYLENIFKANDIKQALAEATAKFMKVDKEFKILMTRTSKSSKCIAIVRQFGPQVLGQLTTWNEVLDKCQKDLEDYMEKKRKSFPRFYFLSDDELIDILANSRDLDIIQGHLKACFDNLVKLTIVDDDVIDKIHSSEKEVVKLKKQVRTKEVIEKWLDQLQGQITETLKICLKEAIKDYNSQPRPAFVRSHYGQVVASVAQIMWCQQTEFYLGEQQINPMSMQDWYDLNVAQLSELIALIITDLSDLERKIIVALVTTDVHARDVIDELKEANISATTDFMWVKQLRYYWDEDADDLKVKQVAATLNYGYEYEGATSRLVITPLTDRCWITISNALHIKLGANPAGPAGTGKTESTKDLAKAAAIQCIVYNCSDQVTYVMMGRLFSGLCQQGCWTCLDEFNRIDVEVLSVIAQQLLGIRNALMAQKTEFEFDGGDEIPLKEGFGCHVTMNPGYAGRTELPDNLKVLFRPVAMMIPSYRMIAEIMLFAEGFGNAKTLSTKMVQLYKLSSEQLSQQDHYDFGLRAVKSVLVMAGSLKRANPTLIEDGVLIRAMRDANVPKFLKDDLPLFSAIIQDLFPGVEIAENDYGSFKDTVEQKIEEADLQKNPVFILKVIQLYETFNVRFGVMLVGPTGSGKSRCYEVLRQTMIYLREQGDPSQTFQNVKQVILNPKAISMGEMYGEVNALSQEWTDGLASKVMRAASQETEEEKTWVIFDGPVDAIWIENMNTVLDDNMTLCLANGQRIKLRPQMRMLFEVEDLKVASPATVSRCGMVYLTPEELGWRPYVKTWLNTHFKGMYYDEDPNQPVMDEDMIDHLWATFNATIDLGLDYIRDRFKEQLATTDLQQVTSLCNLLEYFLVPERGFKGKPDEKKYLINCFFAFSYAWGLGGSLDLVDKEKFDNMIIREQFKLPPGHTAYDYYFDSKKEKAFKQWSTRVTPFVYDKDLSYFDLIVPTADTTKYSFLMEALLTIQKPFFFTGASGTGKTAVIAKYLQQQKDKGTIQPININMSAQTSSLRTQQTIQDKLEKRSRSSYGPPAGKSLVVFIDDINMPAVEEYGAQPPIELIRLLLDKNGFYERSDWSWKDVIDCTIVGCAAPPSGGRAEITKRLSRRFNMFCLPKSSPETLKTIFSSILKGFLGTGFPDKVKNLEDAAINSTIDIFNKIQEDLRPTPTKFHYLFNLRDVSKVIQGLCMTKPVSIQTDETFMRLWVNESFRVFHDRLINDEDREWFVEYTKELIGRCFKMPIDEELFTSLRFGDLLKLDAPIPYYESISDKNKLLKALYGTLDEYNLGSSSKMNLVLFDDAVEHILRIARCLKQPRGHIMLIGVGGSGKQSLLKLCSYMRGIEFKQIEITKGYDINSFLDFMKELMKESGIAGKGISFVMTDTQIIDESFIENLNNLLNTGEIPNLMLPEDKDEIVNGVRPICTEKKIVDTVDNINALFVDRVREMLHICLCMSPVGDTLRIRCRQFPSLVNCMTLDYFSSWPEQALLDVSTQKLAELEDVTEDVRKGLALMCMKIHRSVEIASDQFYAELRRKVYTTPKSYLDLISLYDKVLAKKREIFQKNKNRLAVGLKKLNDTNEEIAILSANIEKMTPQIVKKNEELEVALKVVNADKEIAFDTEKVVSAEAEIVNKQKLESQAIADDCQVVLDAAMPQLNAAKKALSELDSKMITEVKSFSTISPGVLIVVQCVSLLLGDAKKEWKDIKKVTLNNVNEFMNKLMNYDVKKTKEAVWKKARDNFINKDEFEPDTIKSSSVAAATLAVWCISCSKYQAVVKEVTPKQEKLAGAKASLKIAQDSLDIKLAEVKKIKDKVALLEENCQTMQDEKETLENNMARDQARMVRADKLVVLLKDEGVRWKETIGTITGDIERLVGNVFLSCACISYFGPFTGTYRVKMVASWVEECLELKIPTSEDFDLVKVLGDPVVLRGWSIATLPTDAVSQENGILCTQAERYGLCIDPQQQANKWIKTLYKEEGIVVLKFTTKNFLREITGVVRNGKPCLVEDLEENLDPAIDPILGQQQFMTEAGIMQIRLGSDNVDFDEGFKFYMTTKMPNPHYLPEICIKVTLINFTVTFEGLEQQLLGDVVIAEKPEVEEKRTQLVLSMAEDAKNLKILEDTILEKLSSATTEEILDQDDLINILEDSKRVSTEINERMEQSVIIEAEINETRNTYTPVAIRGSILYFVISDLANIDPMYQNSLQYVKQLFNKAILQSPQADTIEERLEILNDKITQIMYTNISRGLFEKDKNIYSFLITTSIKRKSNLIDEGVWNVLLRGPTVFTGAEADNKLPNPDVEVISEILWDTLCSVEIRSQGQFEGLTQHITDNWKAWQKWQLEEDPYAVRCPGEFEDNFTVFDKLVLIKCFRNELIQRSMSVYIISEMGKFYVEPPSVKMEILYQDLSVFTPLIFVLSQGADPTSTLQKFAEEKGFLDEKLHTISLGQGMGPRAAKLITQAQEEGHWVSLQNCHLARSWMGALELIVLDFVEKQDEIHEDFRLFLTSMPAPYFPTSVLQNSVKLTTEPPRGLRANMKRAYQNMSQEYLENEFKPEQWRKLLFNFAFFHACVQERRKFGSLGWNIRYEFNDSDLDTTNTMLKLFLEQEEIPWDALVFVTGDINYGGRVTDDLDRRLLISTLKIFCTPEALKDDYRYSPSGIYYAPADGPIEIYRDYIDEFPLNADPEVFGMHGNANIAYESQESNKMVETILSIQPRVAGTAGGMTPDQIVLEKAKNFLEELPELLNTSEGLKDLFIRNSEGLIPSLSTVLVQEIEKFNRLLKVMRKSLVEIDLAINGFIVMSEVLDGMYLAFTNNVVPKNWVKVGYLSMKPLSSWFKDFLERVIFMRSWLNTGNPYCYWFSAFFFPHGFMTGILQTHARRFTIAIDQLSFAFEVMDAEGLEDVTDYPSDGVGVYISGLFMDGARWDRDEQVIVDQLPAKMTETMPVVWFFPKEEYKPDPDEYQAPLYKTSQRAGVLSTTGQSTNYVLNVQIPSKEPPSFWVQRAAALLSMLND